MATKKVKDFFNGRYFEIPKYQRGFAWDIRNVRDLFDDIYESIETETNHYLGTIVLSNSNKNDDYFIVDGQQRVTTLTLIISAIIKSLSRRDADFFYRFYIRDEDFRLKPLNKDQSFFIDLLKGGSPNAQSKSQRLMLNAYDEITNVINNVTDKLNFLKSIERLEVMEFVENSEGDAIRIFQTVNDRGKPLSNMEKAKSFLVYFSNRYLDKKLDDMVNNLFGDIFELYDQIKHNGENIGIRLIKNVDFNEDNIMRYHFITYSDENYDATAGYVLDFLKNNLSKYRSEDKNNNYVNMEKFIKNYVESLHAFFLAMRDVVDRCRTDPYYYKYFVILGLSATLYPLIVKLEMLHLLDEHLPDEEYEEFSFLDLIEIIDVRVYKTRGTDPRADMSKIAFRIDSNSSANEIFEWLLWFNQRWMSKQEFKSNLHGQIYGNQAMPHIFIDYCESLQNKQYTIDELVKIINKQPTIEHVLSQTPKFSFKSHGFKGEDDFLEHEGTLGNLTLLEKNLNSAVQNKNPTEKISHYDKSIFRMTKTLSSQIAKEKKFKKSNIVERTKILAEYCIDRWWDE